MAPTFSSVEYIPVENLWTRPRMEGKLWFRGSHREVIKQQHIIRCPVDLECTLWSQLRLSHAKQLQFQTTCQKHHDSGAHACPPNRTEIHTASPRPHQKDWFGKAERILRSVHGREGPHAQFAVEYLRKQTIPTDIGIGELCQWESGFEKRYEEFGLV